VTTKPSLGAVTPLSFPMWLFRFQESGGESVVVEPAEAGWEGRLDVANPEMLVELADARRNWWPDDPAFPYRLVCRRHVGALNSSGRDLPRMRQVPYNPAFLHPDDLAALGLEPGHEIEVRSATGVLHTVAAADATLRRGLVSITHAYGDVPGSGLGFEVTGSNANLLVRADANHDRITGMPQLRSRVMQRSCSPSSNHLRAMESVS